MRASKRTVVATLAVVAGVGSSNGCGSDEGGGGRGPSDAGPDGTGIFGGGPGVPPGGPVCQATSECADGLVCHPFAKVCAAPGASCESQSDCDGGTYCDEGLGKCLPSAVGNPCATDANCAGGVCSAGACGCAGIAQQQESYGALDIYFVFDRTSSMGDDCDYQAGTTPPVDSKACFATYALSEYLTGVAPTAPTRLAFQFMSLTADDCDGTLYATPLVDLTPLPLAGNDQVVQAISAENFAGGIGTHIEGAFRGIASYTAAHVTPDREIIGVLMTDGDPNGCNENIGNLSRILADHRAQTGIRTFIIGMEGATDANLEDYAIAGGAEAHADWCGSLAGPCHFWNVGDGSGDAIASAFQAILKQATPLPCSYSVSNLTPPPGEDLDYGKVNVRLAEQTGDTIIGQVTGESVCPASQPAWYYDNAAAPSTIELCPAACDQVTKAQSGARITVVLGCGTTVTIR